MMENKDPNLQQNQIQIELSEEIAQGAYANLAVIAHSPTEFIIDFIRIVPGATKAKVQSRIILAPDSAKRLLYALQDNIRKFEEMKNNGGVIQPFGDIIPHLGGIPGQA
jgi:hypothetical protein